MTKKIEDICGKYYQSFLKLDNQDLTEEEQERAFAKYHENSEELARVVSKPSDMGAIMRTMLNCYRDEVKFDVAIIKVLKKRELI